MPLKRGRDDPEPVLYNGGKIYSKFNIQAYRIMTVATDYKTEKRVKWASTKPTQAEWTTALERIDAARSGVA